MAKKAYVWDGSSWISISSTTTDADSILPPQTGNNGKFLTTNGSSISWGTVDLTPYATTTQLSNHENDTTNIHGITDTSQLALTTGKLSQFSSTTSSELSGVISDETGSGNLVFSTSPVFSGTVTLPTSSSSGSSVRIPHGTAPASPVNGDIWTTSTGIFVRINGVTVGPLSVSEEQLNPFLLSGM